MLASWRPFLLAAVALALLLPGAAARALDQAALEEMESLLRDLGFDPGRVDGVVDEVTIEAIRQYHDFALRPGPPEPSQSLLDELRGVAAAFAALNADNRSPQRRLRRRSPRPRRPSPGPPFRRPQRRSLRRSPLRNQRSLNCRRRSWCRHPRHRQS